MNDSLRMGTLFATAAAIAFPTSVSVSYPISGSETPTLIRCEGGNSCKGQSLCKTSANSCQGQNDCKGKGSVQILAPTQEEAVKRCKEQGGTVNF